MLYNEYKDDFCLDKIEEIFKNIMKNKWLIVRREILSEDLNFSQKYIHNLAVRAVLLNEDELIMDGGNDIS